MAFVTEERKTAQESTFPNTYTFDLFGGVDVSDTESVLPSIQKQVLKCCDILIHGRETDKCKEILMFVQGRK